MSSYWLLKILCLLNCYASCKQLKLKPKSLKTGTPVTGACEELSEASE